MAKKINPQAPPATPSPEVGGAVTPPQAEQPEGAALQHQLDELRQERDQLLARNGQYEQIYAVPEIREFAEERLGLRPAKPRQPEQPKDPRADLPPDRNDWERHHWELDRRLLLEEITGALRQELDVRDQRLAKAVKAQTEEERLRQELNLDPVTYQAALTRASRMSPAERGAIVLRHITGLDAPERAAAAASGIVEQPTVPLRGLPGPVAVAPATNGAPPDAVALAKTAYLGAFAPTTQEHNYTELFGRGRAIHRY